MFNSDSGQAGPPKQVSASCIFLSSLPSFCFSPLHAPLQYISWLVVPRFRYAFHLPLNAATIEIPNKKPQKEQNKIPLYKSLSDPEFSKLCRESCEIHVVTNCGQLLNVTFEDGSFYQILSLKHWNPEIPDWKPEIERKRLEKKKILLGYRTIGKTHYFIFDDGTFSSRIPVGIEPGTVEFHKLRGEALKSYPKSWNEELE